MGSACVVVVRRGVDAATWRTSQSSMLLNQLLDGAPEMPHMGANFLVELPWWAWINPWSLGPWFNIGPWLTVGTLASAAKLLGW